MEEGGQRSRYFTRKKSTNTKTTSRSSGIKINSSGAAAVVTTAWLSNLATSSLSSVQQDHSAKNESPLCDPSQLPSPVEYVTPRKQLITNESAVSTAVVTPEIHSEESVAVGPLEVLNESDGALLVPVVLSNSSSGAEINDTNKQGVKRQRSLEIQLDAHDHASKKTGPGKPVPKKKNAGKTESADAPSSCAPALKLRRTVSFDAMWAGTFDSETTVKPHTLILGTHPSIASLERQQYYGHPVNAFWWIAGDCLGFRRDRGITKGGVPFKFASMLRREPEHMIIPYKQQLRLLVSKGFALWDVVQSCRRQGSLDQDIRDEIPNDIQDFCRQRHPSIRRIVLANGGTGSKLFVKHFASWFESNELVALDHVLSQRAFGPALRKSSKKVTAKNVDSTASLPDEPSWSSSPPVPDRSFDYEGSPSGSSSGRPKITLISAISVSPAAARCGYAEKRDFWEEYVYRPGLQDYQRSVMDNL